MWLFASPASTPLCKVYFSARGRFPTLTVSCSLLLYIPLLSKGDSKVSLVFIYGFDVTEHHFSQVGVRAEINDYFLHFSSFHFLNYSMNFVLSTTQRFSVYRQRGANTTRSCSLLGSWNQRTLDTFSFKNG